MAVYSKGGLFSLALNLQSKLFDFVIRQLDRIHSTEAYHAMHKISGKIYSICPLNKPNYHIFLRVSCGSVNVAQCDVIGAILGEVNSATIQVAVEVSYKVVSIT